MSEAQFKPGDFVQHVTEPYGGLATPILVGSVMDDGTGTYVYMCEWFRHGALHRMPIGESSLKRWVSPQEADKRRATQGAPNETLSQTKEAGNG